MKNTTYREFMNGSPLHQRMNFLGIADAVANQKYHTSFGALDNDQKRFIASAMVEAGLGL